MMTESKKRQESLSILQRLRQQGTPGREEKMESMFDSIVPPEGTEEGEENDEGGELPEGDGNEEQLPPPRKKPKLDAGKVKEFTKGFKSVF